jgi:hypothetical protein
MGRAAIGFEGFDEGQSEGIGDSQRIDLTGSTVRDALNRLVLADPRYSWNWIEQVAVVRPVKAWTDSGNLLNQPIRDVAWENLTAEQALANVGRLLSRRQAFPGPPGQGHDGRLLSVRVQSGSIVDVLNAVVRVHGDLMWSVLYEPHGQNEPAPRQLILSLKWFDGHAVRAHIPGGAL